MEYQDVLAAVGAGSAHPGGMQSTLGWVNQIQIQPEAKVLEVGCGTGRTLSYIASRFACECTGADLRSSMIAKAKLRARKQKAGISWYVANAQELPFADESFDLVFTESVNVFLPDVHAAVKEYRRVLRSDGMYVDVEMALMAPVNAEWKEQVHKVYGATIVPDIRSWRKIFRVAGFEKVRVLHSQAVSPMDAANGDNQFMEDMDLSSPGAYQNPEVLKSLADNATWLEENYRHMGFAIFAATGEGPANAKVHFRRQSNS